jgi:hypothetical protein
MKRFSLRRRLASSRRIEEAEQKSLGSRRLGLTDGRGRVLDELVDSVLDRELDVELLPDRLERSVGLFLRGRGDGVLSDPDGRCFGNVCALSPSDFIDVGRPTNDGGRYWEERKENSSVFLHDEQP